MQRMYGRLAYCALVTCPDCKTQRWYPTSTLRQQLARPNYTGSCRDCNVTAVRAGRKRILQASGSASRWFASNGYVVIGPYAVSDEDLPLYKQMLATTTGNGLLEHRWVMAKHLGRPLAAWECVDHMDGQKTNNALENLRIYVRGKQQPGSCPGYGTYYHEWQMAEKKLRDLGA